MSKRTILFIQGGGEGAYKADEKLASGIGKALEETHSVVYPGMPDEDDPNYETYKSQIEKELHKITGDLILVGHSLGACFLLKYLAEGNRDKHILGLFLLSTPFWGQGGWQYEGFSLDNELAAHKTADIPVFFYQGTNDEIVPFSHLALYKKKFPHATFREIDGGGHQLENNLPGVSEDIKNVA